MEERGRIIVSLRLELPLSRDISLCMEGVGGALGTPRLRFGVCCVGGVLRPGRKPGAGV